MKRATIGPWSSSPRRPSSTTTPACVLVVPVASTVHGYPSEVTIDPDAHNGLDNVSAAQCQHIRAIAVERLHEPVDNIGPHALARLREVLADLFDL